MISQNPLTVCDKNVAIGCTKSFSLKCYLKGKGIFLKRHMKIDLIWLFFIRDYAGAPFLY